MSKKTNLGYYFLITSIAINILTIPPTFAATKTQVSKPHMAGRAATTASNTILSGTSAPKATVGSDGDFFIDTKAMKFYGPKRKGRWLTAFSLRGPQGVAGATGSNGSDGRNAVNAASITGSQGSPGPAGAKGETGAAGPAGAAGLSGAAGATGPAGAAGLPGAAGAQGPSGAAGAQGPSGAAGATGPAGAAGAQGPSGAGGVTGSNGVPGATGNVGATGATGPSNVYVIPITQWTLSTSTAGTGSDSLAFGTLIAGKSYRVSIIVHGIQPTAGSYFGVELKFTSLDCSTFYEGAVIDNKAFVSSSFTHRYTFVIEGTVAVGASNTSLIVRIIDGAGVTSGLESMTLSGKAIVQLVGQIN